MLGSWGAGVAVVGKFVASDRQANTMCFSLGQLDVADEVGVGNFFTLADGLFLEKNIVLVHEAFDK